MPLIHSIQVGQVQTSGNPQSREITDRLWTSAFDKRQVESKVTVSALGIDGDAVADRQNHGGVDKAMLCYALVHYANWQAELPSLSIGPGGFGENLTISYDDESSVCIGDCYLAGSCTIQVSQPRQPCWKISRRWGLNTLTKQVAQTGRTGWYVRVLCGGELSVGDSLSLVERPNPSWTVARANDVLFGRSVDRLGLFELMALPELAEAWKSALS